MIQQAIAQALEGHDFSREEARQVMQEIMAGEATQS
ncbi:MAG: anthranilate phosphoribosyltransferase, partial [Gaiellaceae bacterium]